MHTKEYFFFSIAAFFLLLVFFMPFSVAAEGLVPCSNTLQNNSDGSVTIKNTCTACEIFTLAKNILDFIYTYITIPIVTVMFLWGGFLMLSGGLTGSPGNHQKGLKIMRHTLTGVVIIFCSWLATDTIIKLIAGQSLTGGAPAIIKSFGPWNQVKCETSGEVYFPPPAKVISGNTTSLPDQPPILSGPRLSDSEARARVQAAGMRITSTGNCPDQSNSSCTSLEGIPSAAIDALVALNQQLKSKCASCNLTVSGGTETGHQTHGSGKAIVDISSKDTQVNQFIQGVIGVSNPQINTWYKGGDNQYYFYEGDHWHVCLTSACTPHKVANDQSRGL